jgi:predicted N-acetyltransferase YhbS
MVGRAYEEERDFAAVTRMWREVGWIDDSDAQAEALRRVAARGGGIVADVRGEAECLVLRTPGTVRYLDVDLPLCAISGVTTSHIGRRQHLATDLIVETLTAAAEEGAAVAALGFFEQGFYDRFGFGTASYEHRLRFDPASLDVPAPHRRASPPSPSPSPSSSACGSGIRWSTWAAGRGSAASTPCTSGRRRRSRSASVVVSRCSMPRSVRSPASGSACGRPAVWRSPTTSPAPPICWRSWTGRCGCPRRRRGGRSDRGSG